jgi:hypothetical protein
MPRLSPSDVRSRLRYDYTVMLGLRSDALGPVRPFVSDDDLCKGREASPEDGEAGRVRLYLVEYRFPILIGAGKTMPSASVKFDLLATTNYPFSDPAVTCVSRPFPWSPHVHPTAGIVCLGEGWKNARGGLLAAHLAAHVMRLLNYDEPYQEHYGGWNPPAVAYWRSDLHTRPLNPKLSYPVLPSDITHATEDACGDFQPFMEGTDVASAGEFEPVSDDAIFEPAVVQDADDGDFRPLRQVDDNGDPNDGSK